MPIKKIIIILFLLCSLTGCCCYRSECVAIPYDRDETVLPRCGTMPCTANVIGCCIQSRAGVVHELQCSGVQVIQVGDYVKIVIPSDQLFEHHTLILNRCYYRILNLVGDLLCCPDKTNIKVAAYTDNCGSCLRNLALSREQAQVVADYLWKYGIDVRVLYARGYGECYPIACNTGPCGRSMNRRVEITLRRITDYYDY